MLFSDASFPNKIGQIEGARYIDIWIQPKVSFNFAVCQPIKGEYLGRSRPMRVQDTAPVADNEGLHVVPPEAGGEERQDPLVPGAELQEVSAAGTFLLVVQSRAQTLRDLNTDIQSSAQILIIALLYPDVVALVLSYLGSQGQPSQT